MKIYRKDTLDSTNSWVALHEKELASPALVYCITQTRGRGQRGNSWESAPGKNITASLLFYPQDFPAQKQFAISEAIALAIVDFLENFAGVKAHIKWPNDIYIDDKKIAGILVEHVIVGKTITRSIAGFGINMNQKEFLSDAPNPISLVQITGKEYNIDKAIDQLSSHLTKYLRLLENNENIHREFLSLLWRKDGNLHEFNDKKKGEHIKAKIHDVDPEGVLKLITEKNEEREFAFKEVEFVL